MYHVGNVDVKVIQTHLQDLNNLKREVGGSFSKPIEMKIFFGLVTLIAGIIIFGAGCEREKGGALIVIGIILAFTGFKVIKS